MSKNQVASLLAKAEARIADGCPKSALRELRRAKAANATGSSIGMLSARAYRASGNLQSAIVSVEEILETEPNDANAHFLIGTLWHEAGRPELAVGHLETACKLDPGNTTAHFLWGHVLGRNGRYDEAVSVLEKSTAGQVEDVQPLIHLSDVYRTAGRLPDALAVTERMIAEFPDDARTWLNSGMLRFRDETMTEAEQALNKVIQLAPDEGYALFLLGVAADMRGDVEAANGFFSRLDADNFGVDCWRYMQSATAGSARHCVAEPEVLELAITAAEAVGLVMEFGVRNGASISQIAGFVGPHQPVHGFDSFEGIPEDWGEERAGRYSTLGQVPVVPENITLHVGWFDETLPSFIERQNAPVRFVNVDCDIYSSTKTVLNHISGFVQPGTVIVFDEYLMGPAWRQHEHKAFQEAARHEGWTYEYFAYSLITRQAAVRILTT